MKNNNASVKISAVGLEAESLPERLVGSSSTACVKVDGMPCTAILERVFPIIFNSWYAKHLSHVPLP